MNALYLDPRNGKSAITGILRLARPILNVLLALAISAPVALSVRGNPPVEKSYKIRLSANDLYLYVPVTIHGKSYPFLLDTVSPFEVFDSRLKGCLGKAIGSREVQAGQKIRTIQVFTEPALSLGAFRAQSSAEAHVIDLSVVSKGTGHDTWGILGLQFLGQYSLALDFDRRWMTLAEGRGTPSYQHSAKLLTPPAGRPPLAVECSLPNGKALFSIDTALNDTGWMEHRLFKELLQRRDLELLKNGGAVDENSLVTKRLGRLRSFQVGPFIQHGLLFREADYNCLGLNYLRRYNILFDFKNMKIYMSPSKHFDDLESGGRTTSKS